jgi:hypothetical protein
MGKQNGSTNPDSQHRLQDNFSNILDPTAKTDGPTYKRKFLPHMAIEIKNDF